MIAEASIEVLRAQFGVVHGSLDAESSGADYAHSVFLEDVTVNSVVAGHAPLALSSWRGRTGLSRLPPLWACSATRRWARCVEIDRTELRLYARAVHAATDAYLGTFAPAPDRLTMCVLTALLLSLSHCLVPASGPLKGAATTGSHFCIMEGLPIASTRDDAY
jgi:hypothetical protein